MGRMKIFRLLCGFGLLAVLASNIWTMSRWSESRGVYDDVCYLRQAHLFQRFGLDGGKPKTLEEVGKKFGVTRERIRQLQNIALSKLRRALSKKERPVDVELPVEA